MKPFNEHDSEVGSVVCFVDQWRGRRALCLLIGEGSGPQDEAVRIVGRPRKPDGFTVSWVMSYDPGMGNARRAYEYLLRTYGGDLRAEEVRSSEGMDFHQKMVEAGIVAEVSYHTLSPSTPKR